MFACFLNPIYGSNYEQSCPYQNTKSRKVEPLYTHTWSPRTVNMATMGISTNTRLLGMAIINNGELVAYRIQLHKSSWSPTKATQIITSLEACAQQYSITQVILSIPPTHCQTTEFAYLLARMKAFFETKRIPFATQSSQALHKFCKENSRKTKKRVMRALAERFPELQMYYHKELRNKNKYYVKLFEAVGMAALHEKM
jgi:hypothetical protein